MRAPSRSGPRPPASSCATGLVPAYGVRGEADAAAEAADRAGAQALRAELELLLAQHRRRRDFLLAELRDSSERLAALSHDLRRG